MWNYALEADSFLQNEYHLRIQVFMINIHMKIKELEESCKAPKEKGEKEKRWIIDSDSIASLA